MSRMRGFRNRCIICIDPRDMSPVIAEIRREGWKAEQILGVIPDCFSSLVSLILKYLRKNRLRKILFMSNVRGDVSAEEGRLRGDWRGAFNEDAMSLSFAFRIAQNVTSKMKNCEFRGVFKLKICGDFHVSKCCTHSMILPQYCEDLWELGMYVPLRCFSSECANHVWSAAVNVNAEKLMLEWNNSMTSEARSWQPKLLSHLSVTRHDCVSSSLNGDTPSADCVKKSMNLFFLTYACNAPEDAFQCALRALVSSVWVGKGVEYGDVKFDMDIRRSLRATEAGYMSFYGNELFMFLDSKACLDRCNAGWMSNFIFTVHRSLLSTLGKVDELEFNRYGNCQSYGMRRDINSLRLNGDLAIQRIDARRRESSDDPFSGHLFAFVALMLRRYRSVDLYRWLMLIRGNLRFHAEASGSAYRQKYSALDEKPESRGNVNVWHDAEQINATIQLLSSVGVISENQGETLTSVMTDILRGVEAEGAPSDRQSSNLPQV